MGAAPPSFPPFPSLPFPLPLQRPQSLNTYASLLCSLTFNSLITGGVKLPPPHPPSSCINNIIPGHFSCQREDDGGGVAGETNGRGILGRRGRWGRLSGAYINREVSQKDENGKPPDIPSWTIHDVYGGRPYQTNTAWHRAPHTHAHSSPLSMYTPVSALS